MLPPGRSRILKEDRTLRAFHFSSHLPHSYPLFPFQESDPRVMGKAQNTPPHWP